MAEKEKVTHEQLEAALEEHKRATEEDPAEEKEDTTGEGTEDVSEDEGQDQGDEKEEKHEEADAGEEEGESDESQDEDEDADDDEDLDPKDPEANKVRSKLGRKIKEQESVITRLEQQNARLADDMRKMMQSQENLIRSLQSTNAGQKLGESEDEEWDIPETKAEFDRRIQEAVESHEKQKQETVKQYERNFQREFLLQAERDELTEDEMIATWEELFQNHNVRHGLGAEGDAKVNYANAKASLATKRIPKQEEVKKRNPIKGDPPDAPLGGKGGENVQSKGSAKPVKLGKEANDFLAYLGKKGKQNPREWAEKALKDKTA